MANDNTALQSQLLQAWIMLTTNPEFTNGVDPLPWNASVDDQKAAAKPIAEKLKPYIPAADTNDLLLGVIGSTLLGGNPDAPQNLNGNFGVRNAAQTIYLPFSQSVWIEGPPHPKVEELATFFNQNPVA